MADIEFDDDGKVHFLTKHHGTVVLTRANWENHICGKPERWYYRLNGDKVATTLISPDVIRHHRSNGDQLFYYKSFPKWQLVEGVIGPALMMVMTVVIDTEFQRVCTAYPVQQPKPGKEYKP